MIAAVQPGCVHQAYVVHHVESARSLETALGTSENAVIPSNQLVLSVCCDGTTKPT